MNVISILIAMGLSALLSTATAQWLLIAKKAFQQHQSQIMFLDVGQSAIQYFLRDIQAGGYRGVRSADPSFPLHRCYSQWNKTHEYFRFDRTLFGFLASPGVCYKKMPGSACKRIKENSPVLIIYNVAQKINPLLKAAKDREEPLVLDEDHGIHTGALLLVSDEYQGDLFIANRLQGGYVYHEKKLGVNQESNFSKAYSTSAEVVELQTVAYYLAIPERFEQTSKNQYSQSGFALFRDNFLQHAQEIIAGVSHIEFEYALQNLNDGEIRYNKAENILEKDWAMVRSLRLHLTMENKKTWSFEIAIRNRVSAHFNFDIANANCLAWGSYGNTKFAHLSKR